MNREARIILCMSLALPALLIAQPNNYPITAPPPPPVQQGSVTRIGNASNQTYFYYIVARYPIGNAVRSPGLQIQNAPNILTGTNFVRVSWNGMPNATGYDVLRLTGANGGNFPANGTCVNCLIASNIATTSVDDVSNTTMGNYSVSQAPAANANIFMDNVTQAFPTITFDSPSNVNVKMGRLIAFDAAGARQTKPNRAGTILPTTCGTAETFFLTTTNVGYNCGPDNVWNAAGGGGGGVTGTCDGSVNSCLITTVNGLVTVLTAGVLAPASLCTTAITTPTVFTFAANASAGNPCNLSVGNKVYQFVAPILYTISANGGTGLFYFASNGVPTVGYGGGTFAGGNVTSGAGGAATFPITATPADAYPMATLTAAAGIWTALNRTKSEGGASNKYTAGANMTITQVNDEVTFASTAGFTGTYAGDVTFGANGRIQLIQNGAGRPEFDGTLASLNQVRLEAIDVGGLPMWHVYNGSGSAGVYLSPLGWIQTATIYTVGAGTPLPACAAGMEGVRASVSDLNGPTFLAIAAGGGAVRGGVYCNGTNWIVE